MSKYYKKLNLDMFCVLMEGNTRLERTAIIGLFLEVIDRRILVAVKAAFVE
jgi:hypothetical protein